MLYDNALLARSTCTPGRSTGEPCPPRREETLDYVLREMTRPAGGFYSTQDADSEGEEGKFYVWTPARSAVLAPTPTVAMAYWGVDRGPNFEGHSILAFLAGEPRPEGIGAARPARLWEVRERRVHARAGRQGAGRVERPGVPGALAEAGRALGRADYIAAAVRNAEFLLGQMRVNGRLMRTWKGSPGAHPEAISRTTRWWPPR